MFLLFLIRELGHAVQYREDKDFDWSIRLLAALAFAPSLQVEEWYKTVIQSYQIPEDIKTYFGINLSERKTKMPDGGRPWATKIRGMSISALLTSCHEQTTLSKDFTAVLSRSQRCKTQISGNSSKPSKNSNPCRPLLCLSCSCERKCTRGRKITWGKNA